MMMLPLFSPLILNFVFSFFHWLIFLLCFSWLCFRGFGSPYKPATSLSVPLSKLFTAMLWHGYALSPSETVFYCMIQTAIGPLPTLSKIFEWCIAIDHGSAFTTSSLQFGFKCGLSIHLCSYRSYKEFGCSLQHQWLPYLQMLLRC